MKFSNNKVYTAQKAIKRSFVFSFLKISNMDNTKDSAAKIISCVHTSIPHEIPTVFKPCMYQSVSYNRTKTTTWKPHKRINGKIFFNNPFIILPNASLIKSSIMELSSQDFVRNRRPSTFRLEHITKIVKSFVQTVAAHPQLYIIEIVLIMMCQATWTIWEFDTGKIHKSAKMG